MEVKRILVVDDDPRIQELVVRILAAEDRRVSVVSTGVEARKLLDAETFDLVLLDLYLPDEDGIQLLAYIKERHRLCVIIMTAFGSWDTHIKAYRLGAYYYLDKPFKVTQVRSLVEQALGESALQ